MCGTHCISLCQRDDSLSPRLKGVNPVASLAFGDVTGLIHRAEHGGNGSAGRTVDGATPMLTPMAKVLPLEEKRKDAMC